MDTDVMTKEEQISYRLRSLYRSYGYSSYKMSKFEEYDLYVRNKNFLVSDNIITFTDRTGRLLALKPDVTLSIVKNGRDVPGKVSRIYYNENVYRVAPGCQDFREIPQVGLECIGEIDAYCGCEVLTLAVKSLAWVSGCISLPQTEPEYLLEISHLDIVAGILDSIPVDDEARAAILACIGEKNIHGIAHICAERGISAAHTDALLRLVTAYGAPDEVLPVLRELAESYWALRGPLDELRQMLDALTVSVREKVRIDFSLLNDMTYYNGIVFRGYIKGIPDGILSGGRYDRLMRKMGRHSDAIGFAVYLDLLIGHASIPEDLSSDAVILYDDTTDLRVLNEAVASHADKGERVTVLRTLPANTRPECVFDLRRRREKT